MISIFTYNSEKLIQILFEFSPQIVGGHEIVLANFRWKKTFQSNKLSDLISSSPAVNKSDV